MNTFKEKLEKINNLRYYMTKERFKKMIATNDLKIETTPEEMFNEFSKNFTGFILKCNEDLLNALFEYNDTIIKVKNVCFIKQPKYFVKVIYKKDDNINSVELNLVDIEDNIVYVSILSKYKIIAINRLCDKVKDIKIYENDIIRNNDDFSSKKSGLYIALMSEDYIINSPYYKELLYTEKYGYWNPNKSVNIDNNYIKIKESMFNVTDNNYNYHVISCCSTFKILGNIATDSNILNP